MKLPESLRLRIQIWHGFLLASVLVVFAFAAYKYQDANDIRQIDEQLTYRLRVLLKILPPPPPAPAPDLPHSAPAPKSFKLPASRASLFDSAETPSFYYALWGPEGALRSTSKSAPKGVELPVLLDEETHHSGERTREEFREMFTFTPSGECVLVGRSIAADLAELRAYARWLAALSVGVLILGLAVGWAIATRSLHSVGLISETARKIAAGSLSERISIREKRSELGVLANTLNETFSRIECSFARQLQFVADAAHELRTPVAIILAQAQQTLNRERDPETYRKALESCVSAARRLRTLTDCLLELAMHDAGVAPPNRAACDLAGIAREATDSLLPMLQERSLNLVLNLQKTLCTVDPQQIIQLILNLVSNAADHTPPGGCITVHTWEEADSALLRVHDTGEGISAEALPRIFDRFFRADNSRSRKTGGAGLGLAICRAIAEGHGAQLTVESSPGGGSTFTLKIPAPLREAPAC
jgi:heavy metal sensor kinase